MFMENLDSTIIATSLPAIAVDLNEDPISLKLALTSYLLSLAVFIPASGWAADRYGTRTVFRAAIAVFTLGSILCGLSSSLPQFIGARIVQGMGGAMMVPVGRLIVYRSVDRADLVRALAYLSVPSLIGPVLGPPIGGFITTYFHWRWIFWLNVPIGVLGMIFATRYVEQFVADRRARLDLAGFALVGFGLSAVIFGFTIAGRGFVGPLANAALIGAGALALAAYVAYARRTPHAIVDLSLMRIPTFRASVTGGFVFRIGVGAMPFLLPLLLQLGFGLTPFQSGLLTFASSAGALLMKTTAGPILGWGGFRRVMTVNAVASAAMLAACGLFRPDTPHAIILLTLLAGGFLRSLQFTAINALAFADIPNERLSKATSLSGTMQQLSLTSGVAVGAAVLETTRFLQGDPTLEARDFAPAFFVVAAISALSVIAFARMSPDAAASLSRGRRQAGD
ncbi:MAG: MFS transporter [Methylobacteriaceae bacterium]|nr:MFS transporter [Methylobacteriaceae bacterium]